jgi:hypothetical protein
MITANLNYQGDPKYKKLIEASVADMVTVLNDPKFKSIFTIELNESRNKLGKLQGELSFWASKSGSEIYERLFMNGTSLNDTLRLNVRTYYSPKRVIGYGVASDDWINVNTKYLRNYTIDDPYDRKEVGSNLGHEEYHSRGMSHDFKNTARRKHSVAYIFNRAYERAYDEIIINAPNPGVEIEVRPKPVPKAYKKPWWRFF